MTKKNSLYPLLEHGKFHDACGTGFITEISGVPSRRVIDFALESLEQLTHRGAQDADAKTGDGSGILTDIPKEFFRKIIIDELGYKLAPDKSFAVGMIFSTKDEKLMLIRFFKSGSKKYGFEYLGFREVPVHKDALGDFAQKTCPCILQLFISCPDNPRLEVESLLLLMRKFIEKKIARKRGASYICSLSSKTILYKGLLTAHQLRRFYDDLVNPEYVAKVAIFHERYSTNTISNWAMAQPFRFLAHNGEINTIKGNRLWMRAREGELRSEYWGDELEVLKPIISEEGSDSFSLDNALEFLTRSGRDLFHSIMMLIPDYYAHSRNIEQTLKDFFIYHENLIEPWDGPAAIVFTDGDFVGAKLDRNGLRPLRYTVTKDGLIIMASEAGVIEVETENLEYHRHMAAGEILSVDLNGGGILENNELKKRVSENFPSSKLLSGNFKIIRHENAFDEFNPFELPSNGFDKRLRSAFGWEKEDLSRYLIPMAKTSQEPIGSMGDDTPPAVLSSRTRPFYDYFKHTFAQVTNPPIDPIREKFVTSLYEYLGSEANLLSEKPSFNGAIRIESPILSPRELSSIMENHSWLPHIKIFSHLSIDGNIKNQLETIMIQCEEAVRAGHKLIMLSDEEITSELLPIPMALTVSAVHHHLISKKIRSKVSLLCLSGDIVEDHHVACLVALGASAVYPYMAYELIREEFSDGEWTEMMGNYRYALEKGLLKIMAKSGITTRASYHGSMLLHGFGMSQELLDDYFPSIKCQTGGINLGHIEAAIRANNSTAFSTESSRLKESGRFNYRKNGEKHGYNPAVFKLIHKSSHGEPVDDPGIPAQPVYIRDLLAIKKKTSVPLEQGEEVSQILRRFGAGGMSFGAISEEVHRTIARGFNMFSGRSNTGEGGEQPDRYAHSNPDKIESCYVKQISSGRFGVTPEYLAAANEIQIKISQGSKPGEGGQLPGHKVTMPIAVIRNSTPGVPLISPPPHHDIYSIEDIAQLIYDLKKVNPRAPVSVKLVSQPGVGLIASGVVKGGADIVLISGHDGGTGASPLGSIKHCGFPWEFGLAETHQVLTANGLRERMTLRVDGGLKNARDLMIAACLGAEEFDFGTTTLIALGCVMARQCHLNTCPVGIATQSESLKKKFKGKPENLIKYYSNLAEDFRRLLTESGFYSIDDLVGRTDILKLNPDFSKLIAERGIDLSAIINPHAAKGLPLKGKKKYYTPSSKSDEHLDEAILSESRQVIMTHGNLVLSRRVRNTDRSIGTRLAGELSFLFGENGFKGHIQLRLKGFAGQSFGAFLTEGLELRLNGAANDYVGKGMSGGLITIRFDRAIRESHPSQTIIGNVALYGATGGKLLVAGKAGERFAVRNSGAVAVVEGTGSNCCEYMTRGTVLVLGAVGKNFGAGMSGGEAYVRFHDEESFENLNAEFVRAAALQSGDERIVLKLLRDHRLHTGSLLAKSIIKNWDAEKTYFYKIIPLTMDIINFDEIYDQQISNRMSSLMNE
ncbi:MAG: glutamate synthase large subunit [Candidatus Marinimicrobia bacterium]|nr:glutamate synthase large subunit [Candidatus Neomarinimicrobiota bacterium]